MMNNECALDELIKLVQRFCEERDWDQFHNPKDLAIGISTEANELLDHFRFKNEEEQVAIFANASKREAVEDELADTLFFLLRFAQMNDVDLEEALRRKIEKNGRKYPVETAKGSNRKYNE